MIWLVQNCHLFAPSDEQGRRTYLARLLAAKNSNKNTRGAPQAARVKLPV